MPAGDFSPRQAYRRRRLAALGLVAVGVAAAIVWASEQRSRDGAARPVRARVPHAKRATEDASGERAERRITLVQRPIGYLYATVQEAAAAPVGRSVLLLG